MKRGLANLSRVIASNGFFKAILIIFVLQAIWIAISAGYPQPFDENTHFGLIQLYSHHWLPFISEPTTANTFGVVSRDPSYLYHYLLSFPYRLSAHFLRNVDEQILFMRLFSIAFFAWGLVLFRKLLGYCKVSDGVLNASLLFFVLIPVVPLLAGQLNYDNLLMLLTPAVLLAAVRFTERLKAGEFNLSGLCICLALGLLASITQIDFLPIFVGIIVWVVFELSRFHKYGGQFKVGRLNAVIIASSLFLIITTGLAAQRYGYNLVQYHALVPACEQVKNEQACALNGSWERAHQEKQRPQPTSHNPVRYLVSWVARMQITSFYVRSGGADKRAYYKNVGPYIILRITSAVLAFAGAVLFLVYLPSIIRGRPYLVVSLGISIFYCLVLFAHLYASYLATGAKDGINGRYLFPVMLPFMVAAGLGFQRFMSHWERLIPAVFFVVLVLFLQGGGILTFISASNKYWYWPDNRLSNHLNSNAQKIVNPLIIK